jgi:large subunit ribosomal protein L23
MRNILVKPVVSEKATTQAGVNNKFHFIVSVDANKIEIKKAVEARFDVKVADVHTLNVEGKTRVQQTKTGRFSGKKADTKKAIVTLKDGFSLDVYSSPEA